MPTPLRPAAAPQDDLLFESLTVYETLYYAAMLRLPGGMPREEKLGRVQAVVSALGLGACQGTIVGGFARRGVSGGERKRVSIGHELLTDPAALVLDEPTSGLDATTALRLVRTLRSLARAGRSVVATVHQPSSRLFGELDRLLLLGGGRALYFGGAGAAAGYLGGIGREVPYGVGVADHLLDLASGDAGALADRWASFLGAAGAGERERLRRRVLGYPGGGGRGDAGLLAALVGGKAPPAADLEAGDVAVALDGGSSETDPGGDGGSPGGGPGGGAAPAPGATWAQQVAILAQRSVRTRRFEALGAQRFWQLAATGLLTGLLWWQRAGAPDALSVADTGGLLFFEMLFLTMGALFNALFTFPQEFRLLVKERASGMYRLSAFYVARLGADLPLDCLYPTVFVGLVYWLGGLRPAAGAFLANWATAVLLILVAQSIGLVVGALCVSPKTSQAVATVVIMTFMLTGGFYLSTAPPWIAWAKYVGFIYYGWNTLLFVEFHGRRIEAWPEGFPSLGGLRPGRDVGVLVAILVALRVANYFVLRRKTGGGPR